MFSRAAQREARELLGTARISLPYSCGSWCVALAAMLYFSALDSRLALHPWLILILLSMTVPVTTLLLARVALFRWRAAGSRLRRAITMTRTE